MHLNFKNRKVFFRGTVFFSGPAQGKTLQLCCSGRKFFFFRILLILFFLVPLHSCDKDYNEIIPDVPVTFSINLNIANELTVPGNSVLFPYEGYGGVIVYCKMPGSYYAFDA